MCGIRKKGTKDIVNQYLLRFDQCLLENRYFIENLLNMNIKCALFPDNLQIELIIYILYFQIESACRNICFKLF